MPNDKNGKKGVFRSEVRSSIQLSYGCIPQKLPQLPDLKSECGGRPSLPSGQLTGNGNPNARSRSTSAQRPNAHRRGGLRGATATKVVLQKGMPSWELLVFAHLPGFLNCAGSLTGF
jgi:hypothetical protein